MVRPVTENLIRSITSGMPLTPATVCDYGLNSRQHFEAIAIPYRKGEVTPDQLDEALGNGPRLTTLVNSVASNPHKGIIFETAWDSLEDDEDEDDEDEEEQEWDEYNDEED